MLVLFETPAGYALFSVKDSKKLDKVDNIYDYFATPEKANQLYVQTIFILHKFLIMILRLLL